MVLVVGMSGGQPEAVVGEQEMGLAPVELLGTHGSSTRHMS